MNKILFTLFYIFCLFPYIRVIPLNTDTQPNALIIAILIVIFNYKLLKNNFKKEFMWLFIVLISSVFIMIFSGINFNSFRSLYNYISVFFIPVAGYIVFKREKRLNEKIIKISIIVWFVVGLIQMLAIPTFMSFLVMRSSANSYGRGVCSLATEPTFYGITCIFFILLVLKFKNKRKRYIALLIVQIVFIGKSSMATLMLIIFIFIFIFLRKIKKLSMIFYIIGFIFMFLAIYKILEMILPDSRVFSHLSRIINDPIDLLLNDASISQRASSIYFSIKGFIINLGIPNGFNAYQDFMFSEIASNTIPFSSIASGTRIMSGIGGCLYEIGIFGVVLLFNTINKIANFFSAKSDRNAIVLCSIFMMLMAINIGSSLFMLIVSYGIYLEGVELSDKSINYNGEL